MFLAEWLAHQLAKQTTEMTRRAASLLGQLAKLDIHQPPFRQCLKIRLEASLGVQSHLLGARLAFQSLAERVQKQLQQLQPQSQPVAALGKELAKSLRNGFRASDKLKR